MLLEDSLRGTMTECLLCKHVMPAGTAGTGGVPSASSTLGAGPPPLPGRAAGQTAAAQRTAGNSAAPPLPSEAPSARDWRQLQCPQCQATLRIPGHIVNQPVRCKNCQHVFEA